MSKRSMQQIAPVLFILCLLIWGNEVKEAHGQELDPNQKDWIAKYETQKNAPKASEMLLNTDVEPDLTEVLIDLAIKIDDDSKFPVDVEHVLAAIVFANQAGEVDSTTELAEADEKIVSILASHVETVFQKFDGKVGRDD